MTTRSQLWLSSLALAALLCCTAAPTSGQDAALAAQSATIDSGPALDAKLTWGRARRIVVDSGTEYVALDRFAEQRMIELTGAPQLPGLTPSASLLEWLFNSRAYDDVPLVYVGEGEIRTLLAARLSGDAGARVGASGKLTPRELGGAAVQQALQGIEANGQLRDARERISRAWLVAFKLHALVRIVPVAQPMSLSERAPWLSPRALFVNTPSLWAGLGWTIEDARRAAERDEPIAGMSESQATELVWLWVIELRRAWLDRDADKVQRTLEALADSLRSAAAGAYPRPIAMPDARLDWRQAAALDAQIDWSRVNLLAVQDSNRYKTLDTFAREWMSSLTNAPNLPGLSPAASLFEWLFNQEAYFDEPLVYVKDRGLRIHFSAHFPAEIRQRIVARGMMSLREFTDPIVEQRIRELNPRFDMRTAMNRVGMTRRATSGLEQIFCVVPQPGEDPDAVWHTPTRLLANATRLSEAWGFAAHFRQHPDAAPLRVEGVSEAQAEEILKLWAPQSESGLWAAWRSRDAARVQAALDGLAAKLPALASTSVYPSLSQRMAEARYHAMGKFTWGWAVYLLGAIVGVYATITRWRAPWIASLLLLATGLALHGYGVGLRWYILGRIPVANMFEAIVASAWMGTVAALVIELIYRTRVFALAANATGFFALILAQYVVPGSGALTGMLGILDDVMLRIHTVMIICSYALIFLAGVIALCYLFGYYANFAPARSREVGLLAAWGGLLMSVFALSLAPSFAAYVPEPNEVNGWTQAWWAPRVFLSLSGAALVGLTLFRLLRGGAPAARFYAQASLLVLFIVGLSLGATPRGFSLYLGYVMLGGGLLWAGGNIVALMRTPAVARAELATPSGAAAVAALSLARGGATAESVRPILAGAMPGDEKNRALPTWLHSLDWSHLIILNMVFILLFVGIVLGAVWADYSWGRPWGWDPKEVFALNTWIIYAILIHARFVVRERGLWTAWLSVAGCLMMAFNWCFVNFFIQGLHSYA